jgi:hypothetical protein
MANPAQNDISLVATPTTLQTSVGGLVGIFLFMLGVLIFRRYFMNRNWRITIVWTSALLSAAACLGLMTIYDSWGIGQDGWFFIITGTVIPDFIQGIAQVVSSLAVAEIAPAGGEAFAYEFLTSVMNCSIALNLNLGNIFVSIFSLGDITLEKYISADVAQKNVYNATMAYATYAAAAINVAGFLVFIWFLPTNKQQTRTWLSEKGWHRPIVGYLGLGISVALFIFATSVSFLSLFPETMCLQIAGGSGC